MFNGVLGRAALSLALVSGVLGLSCADAPAGIASGPPASSAGPLRVERGELRPRVLLTGALAAEDAVTLAAPNVDVWPLQVRWTVEDGAEVAVGDPVVELDNSQLVGNLEELRAAALEAANRLDGTAARVAGEVAAAALELERAEATLQKARLDAAVPDGVLAEQQLADRRKELRRAELERAEAETKVEAKRRGGLAEIELERIALGGARKAVERAESGIALLTLRAPRGGVVVLGEAQREGRTLRAGDAVWPGSVVARLPDLATLLVEASLFDVDDGAVVPGLAVTARLDAFPERVFPGHVVRVDRAARELGRRSRRRSFGVAIALDERDPERMRPGMSVKVEVEVPPRADVLLAPREAIVWEAGGVRLRLADGGLAPVVLGLCDARRCVLEEGPSEGTLLADAEASS